MGRSVPASWVAVLALVLLIVVARVDADVAAAKRAAEPSEIGDVRLEDVEEDEFAEREPARDPVPPRSSAQLYWITIIVAGAVAFLVGYYTNVCGGGGGARRDSGGGGPADLDLVRRQRLAAMERAAPAPEAERLPRKDKEEATADDMPKTAPKPPPPLARSQGGGVSGGADSAKKPDAKKPDAKAYEAAMARDAVRVAQRTQDTPLKVVHAPAARPAPAAAAASDAAAKEATLTHLQLQDVFQVLLRAEDRKHLPHYQLLPSLAQELAATQRTRFELTDADSVLMERLAMLGPGPGICYLLECFARARAATGPVAVACQRSIVTQARIFVQLKAAQSSGRDDVLLYLLQQPPPDAQYALRDFVGALAKQIVEDDEPTELAAIFGPPLAGVAYHMRSLHLLSPGLRMPFDVLDVLAGDARVAGVLVSVPNWCDAQATGAWLERHSFLGPFFALSPQAGAVMKELFLSASDANAEFEGVQAARRHLQTLHKRLESVTGSLLRHSSSRVRTVQWLSTLCAANVSVTKMQYDRHAVSGDGTLMNAFVVVARLFAEQWDAAHNDDAQLDPLHWLKYMSLGWREADPINAEVGGASTADFRTRTVDNVCLDDRPVHGPLNDLLYLALALANLAVTSSKHKMDAYARQMGAEEDRARQLEADQPQWERTPTAGHNRQQLREARDNVKLLRAHHLGVMCQLLQPELCELMKIVYGAACAMILRHAGADDSAPIAQSVAALPQFLLSNMCDFFALAISYKAVQISGAGSTEPLLELVVRMVGSSARVQSPYVRGQLATLMSLLPPSSIENNAYARRFLAPSLISLFCAVETTGRHNQFYEKMSLRASIMSVVANQRGSRHFDEAFVRHWQQQRKSFVQFVHLLLADLNYCLDDAFEKLGIIARTELAMRDPMEYGRMPEEQRQREQEVLQESLTLAKSWLSFATLCIEMMLYLTQVVPDAVLAPEVIRTCTDNLDFFLVKLAGESYNRLNVRDPERFKFHPQQLLTQLLTVYNRLGASEAFVQAMALDQRSFDAKQFRHALVLMERHGMGTAADRAQFARLIVRAEEARAAETAAEAVDAEAPDEFRCEITDELMADPVRLPSGHVVERAAILRHLLSSATDPYTRKPLTEAELVPHTELAERIAAFRGGKKHKADQ